MVPYTPVATCEFGSSALKNNDARNATIMTNEPCLILRVDPHLYRDTAAWFARALLEKKANLLSHIPELRFLREMPPESNIFTILADYADTKKVQNGQIIDKNSSISSGFIVVEEGLIAKMRVVDFSLLKNTDFLENSNMMVQIPKGRHPVAVEIYGPKSMVPDPSQTEIYEHPFYLVVQEPGTIHDLKLNNLKSTLFSNQIERIQAAFRNEPSDLDVIKLHISRLEAANWKIYKKRCVKESRDLIKMEKSLTSGTWGMRKATVPKPLKEYNPLPIKNYQPLAQSTKILNKRREERMQRLTQSHLAVLSPNDENPHQKTNPLGKSRQNKRISKSAIATTNSVTHHNENTSSIDNKS